MVVVLKVYLVVVVGIAAAGCDPPACVSASCLETLFRIGVVVEAGYSVAISVAETVAVRVV